MAQIDLNKQIKMILKKAEESGVAENFFFLAAFNDYKKIRGMLIKMEEKINEGVMLEDKVNPCITEYAKLAQHCVVLGDKIMKLISDNGSDKKKTTQNKSEKTIPDFKNLTTSELNKWCRKFDIDPNDYAKSYLFKALEKRWKFEYGE